MIIAKPCLQHDLILLRKSFAKPIIENIDPPGNNRQSIGIPTTGVRYKLHSCYLAERCFTKTDATVNSTYFFWR